MRLTITLCLLVTVLVAKAQVTILPPSPEEVVVTGVKCRVGERDTARARIQLRCGTAPQYPSLFIVDGRPVDSTEFKDLDPSDILKIDILKNVRDKRMGGIVLITTKKKREVLFNVKETTTKGIIPGATLRFSSIENNRVQMFTADEAGNVYATGLTSGEEYELVITSVGYLPSTIRYKHQLKSEAQEILLERNIINGPEVVIVSYPLISCRSFTRCGSSFIKSKIIASEEVTTPNHFVVFPNPSSRGNVLTVDFTSAEQQAAVIRIHGRDGKLVWERSVQAVKGPNRFTVNTDSRWAAGVYFLQLIDARKQVMKTERVVIQ